MLHHDSVICEKCHNSILQELLLTCIICEKTVAKKCLVGKHKYALLKHTMPQIANIPKQHKAHMQYLLHTTTTKHCMCVLQQKC